MSETTSRRKFLGATAAAGAAGVAIAANPFAGLQAMAAAGGPTGTTSAARWPGRGNRGGYGALAATKPAVTPEFSPAFGGAYADPDAEWLAVPEGFSYVVLGLTGTTMSDGNRTPQAHDGMGAYGAGRRRVRLVRNHENRDSASSGVPPMGGPTNAYNPLGAGGNTTLELSFPGGVPTLERDFVSLNGTIVNCAGGQTPWGSWLSCEETTETRGGIPHGYVFEVPSSADSTIEPTPLKGLGRFVHEAAAVDPRTGIVYETEDRSWAEGDDDPATGSRIGAGFFRFVPDTAGDLSAGVLQALKVRGVDGYLTVRDQRVGRPLAVEWVTVDDPDPANADVDPSAVFRQARSAGAAIFQRLEGVWWGRGVCYFVSTSGGDVEHGQVWEYRPTGRSGGLHKLVYESPDPEIVTFPDNLGVTPRGGIVLCEDTGYVRSEENFLDDGTGQAPFAEQKLKGLSRHGQIFDFAVNLLDNKEWAGACWSPDGKYLFANTQGETREPGTLPGRTYAIWGPWEQGAL
jgi:hypothetical protein